MGLDLQWLAPDRSVFQELLDPDEVLARALTRGPRQAFPLLSAIDPYTNTDVSPSATLSAEIRRLRDAQTDPAASIHLGRMLAISEGAEQHCGSFLRFFGD